jgi:hypothetical protein
MRPKQPGIPKLPHITGEPPPVSIDFYPNPPLTEEQKKWPVVPLSKMHGRPKQPKAETDRQPAD